MSWECKRESVRGEGDIRWHRGKVEKVSRYPGSEKEKKRNNDPPYQKKMLKKCSP